MKHALRTTSIILGLVLATQSCTSSVSAPDTDAGVDAEPDVGMDRVAPPSARFAGTCDDRAITGEAMASADSSASGFRYSIFPEEHWMQLVVFDEDEDAAGTMLMQRGVDRVGAPRPTEVSIQWFADREIDFATDDAAVDPTFAMVASFRAIDSEHTEQKTIISGEEGEVEIVTVLGEGLEDAVIAVRRQADTVVPSEGASFATLGGEVVHTLDLLDDGVWLEEEAVRRWGDSVALPSFASADETAWIAAALRDEAWLLQSIEHVEGCRSAEAIGQLQSTLVSAQYTAEDCNIMDILTTGGGTSALVSLGVAIFVTYLAYAGAGIAAAAGAVALSWAAAMIALVAVGYFVFNKICDSSSCAAACKQQGNQNGGYCRTAISCVCGARPKGSAKDDPHLVSFDGLYYDVQAAGEFVMAEATAGSPFTVQARMEPVVSARCPHVSLITAVVTDVGGTKVEARLADPDVLYVDGFPVELHTRRLDLPNGGSINQLDSGDAGWELRYPGGERMIVHQDASIDIHFDIPPHRRGQIHGLLGTYDAKRDNDFTLRTGEVMQQPVEFFDFYEQFVDSWRVTPEESMFDYAAGQDTSTFTISGFPAQPQIVPEGPDAVAAEQTCIEAGVTDPVLLESCTLDVYCAGEEFAQTGWDLVNYDEVAQIGVTPLLDGWSEQGSGTDVMTPLTTSNTARSAEYEGPIFYVSPDDRSNFHVRATITADAADDDVVGLVFGYQSPIAGDGDDPLTHDMFVFGWKQASESHPSWGNADEGMYLAHVHGQAANIDAASTLFWNPANGDPMLVDVIATNTGVGTGYVDDHAHRIDLYYTSTGIRIDVDGTTVFDVSTIDLPRPPTAGRIGFMTLSQGAQFVLRAADAAPGYCDRSELEVVPCEFIDEDMTLDGQIMICPDGPGISANLTMVNGSALLTGGRISFTTGSIQATGTQDCPILFGSSDDILGQGDIAYIHIASPEPSSFEHVVFERGGDDNLGTNYLLNTSDDSTVSLQNVTFRHTTKAALDIRGTTPVLQNLTFSHVPGVPLILRPWHIEGLSGVKFDPGTIGEPYIDIDRNIVLDEDYVWSDPGEPVRLGGDLTFRARLEITAGMRLLVEPGRRFSVSGGGRLIFNGTAAQPITLQSSGLTIGDWQRFTFQSDAGLSEFRHTTLAHGGAGGFGVLNTYVPILLDNVTFIDNEQCDVYQNGAGLVTATNTTFMPCN